jgi:hypothetical protein
MEIEASYVCAYCLQINTIMVDITEGVEQEYIEDCQICCRPNALSIIVDEESETATVEAAIS